MNPRLDTLHVDWFQLLSELRLAGVSDYKLSSSIHVPRSTILGWKQGAEPKHADGEQLLAFWMAHLKRGRADIPVISWPDPLAKR